MKQLNILYFSFLLSFFSYSFDLSSVGIDTNSGSYKFGCELGEIVGEAMIKTILLIRKNCSLKQLVLLGVSSYIIYNYYFLLDENMSKENYEN
jgi:hypothetical protein